jgi:hypothetical protein
MVHAVSILLFDRKNIRWRELLLSGFAVVVLVLPLVFFILLRDSGQVDWIQKPEISDLYRFFKDITGSDGRAVLTTYFLSCFISTCYAFRSWYEVRRFRVAWPCLFLCVWLFMPIVVVYLISIYSKPLFLSKYLIITLPPLALLAGNGVSRIQNKYVLSIFIILFMTLSLRSVVTTYYPKPKENWRDATSYVISRAGKGDAIIFYSGNVINPFDYYRKCAGVPPDALDCIYPYPLGAVDEGKPIPKLTPQFLRSLEKDYERLWIVLSHDDIPQFGNDSRPLLESLNSDHQIQLDKIFPGIRVVLFKRT